MTEAYTDLITGKPLEPWAQEMVDRRAALQPQQGSLKPAGDVERGVVDMLTRDHARMRKAGTALAEAALRVIREYDGCHRLALAVADWSKAVADEGDRASTPSGEASTASDQLPRDRYDETALDRLRDHAVNGTMPPQFRKDLHDVLDLATPSPSIGDVDRMREALDRARNRLPHVEIPAMEGDNLAVTLCSHFDDAEGDQDDNGWTEAATDGCDKTLTAIHQVYVEALAALNSRKDVE